MFNTPHSDSDSSESWSSDNDAQSDGSANLECETLESIQIAMFDSAGNEFKNTCETAAEAIEFMRDTINQLNSQSTAIDTILDTEGKVVIKVYSRGKRHAYTIVEHLERAAKYERVLKRRFAAGVSLEHADSGDVLVIQGDMSRQTKQFIITNKLATNDNIIVIDCRNKNG